MKFHPDGLADGEGGRLPVLPADDHDNVRLARDVGENLVVVRWGPGENSPRHIVECVPAWMAGANGYQWFGADQEADARDGYAVFVCTVLEPYAGEIPEQWILRLRYGDRSQRSWFANPEEFTPQKYRAELREREEKRVEPYVKDGVHNFEEAYKDTWAHGVRGQRVAVPAQIGG